MPLGAGAPKGLKGWPVRIIAKVSSNRSACQPKPICDRSAYLVLFLAEVEYDWQQPAKHYTTRH